MTPCLRGRAAVLGRVALCWMAVLISGAGAVGGVARAAPDGVAAADRVRALSDAGKRRALLVGTTRYSDGAWRTLPNVARDVATLGAVLERRYGYEVQVVADPDLAGIKKAVRAISEAAGPADDVLVFFSGHGYFDEVDRAGYLVSRDGTAQCESGCYPLDNVKRGLYGTAARHVLVMLDVCHGGTFDLQVALGAHDAPDKGETPAMRRLLTNYAQAASRLMFASVGRGVTSDGRAGSGSPFMTSLLAMLDVAGAGVVDVDSVYVAMSTAKDPLPVLRPVPFESNIPHHGQGHFLFIERVDFCEMASAIVGAPYERVGAVSAAVERPYGRSWAGPWILPGARECRVWQWGEGGLQYGCAFGPVGQAEVSARAAELVAQVARCFPAEARADEGAARLRVRGRTVRAQGACGDVCEVVMTFE